MSTTGILLISPNAYPGSGAQLDLSQYMRVNQGDGLDPYDPQFTQKTFSHALLKEGGVLALESLALKEMQFPMYFSALSRDAVSALVQQVNAMINAPGQTVGWQDQGASQMTFFDLASGQIDIQYDFRRAGNYIIGGLLRLFVQPLGHTATMRLVASAAGTGPLLTLPIPSPILGDAGALIQAQIRAGVASMSAHRVAVSVIPPAYTPEFQSPSLMATTGGHVGTLVGASGAVASQLVRVTYPPGANATFVGVAAAQIPTYAAYAGVNRVLAVARYGLEGPGGGTAWLQFAIPEGNGAIVGATAPLSGVPYQVPLGVPTAGWNLVDLGVFSTPSSVRFPTAPFIQVYGAAPSLGATSNIDICDLIILPDGQTAYCDSASLVATAAASVTSLASAVYTFDGLNSESYLTDPSGSFRGRLSPYQRGAIPKLQPALAGPIGASQRLAVVLLGDAVANPLSAATSWLPANDLIAASVTVRERFRFDAG